MAACLAAAKPVPIDATGLDLSDCSVSAAGRDVTKLNLAFATPSTGLCLAPGKCFVPLANGAHGWKQDGARLKLPRGACSKYFARPEKSVTLYDVSGCAPMTSSTTICSASTIADGGADGGGDASLPPATGTPTDRLVTADMPYSLREVGDDGSQLNYRLVTPEGVSGVVRDIMGNLTVTQVKPKQFAGTILRTSTFTRSPCRPFVTSDQQAWSFDGTAYAAVTPFVVGAEKLLMSACDPNYQAWLTTEALWTVNTLPSNFNPSTVAVKAPVPAGGFGEPSAMVFLGEDTIIGNRAGELFLCTGLNPVDCSQKQTVSAAPGPHEILDITFTNTVDSSGKQVNPGYILATDGLYLEQFPPGSLFNTFGPAPKLVAPGDFLRPRTRTSSSPSRSTRTTHVASSPASRGSSG